MGEMNRPSESIAASEQRAVTTRVTGQLRSRIGSILPLLFLVMVCPARSQTAQSVVDSLSTLQLRPSSPQICERHAGDTTEKLSLGGHSFPEEGQAGARQDASSERVNNGTANLSQSSGQSHAGAPNTPVVTYSGGLITVRPNGASMRDVLQAIGVETGIALDLPSTGIDGRLFDEQIGPVPVREALLQLLYGCGLNYMIQDATVHPQLVARVVVSRPSQNLKDADGKTAMAKGQSRLPEDDTAEPTAYGAVPEQVPEDEEPVVSVTPSKSSAAGTSNVPGIPDNFNLQDAAAQAHKTPAEILDELQKRQLEILNAQAPPP